jgi:hypothetical protein
MHSLCRSSLLVLLVALAVARADDPAKQAAPAEPPSVHSLSFSPDGSLLAAGLVTKTDGGCVIVWNVHTKSRAATWVHVGLSPVVTYASDSNSLAVASGEKSLKDIDPAEGIFRNMGPFPSEVTSVLSGGTGRWITLGKDGAIHVWDDKQRKIVQEITGMKRVSSWAASPGGKWLYFNGDGQDRVWNLSAGKEVQNVFKRRPGSSNVGVFLSEDRLLIASNSGSHRVIELPSGKEVMRFKNEGGTGAVSYSPSAGVLACRYYSSATAALTPLTLRPATDAEKTRTAELLKACDSDDYATREKAAAQVVELGSAIEPLLRTAMSQGPSAEVRMRARVARDTILNKPKFELRGHTAEIRPMKFSPDGKLFATGAADGLVILWDPRTGKEVARLTTWNN